MKLNIFGRKKAEATQKTTRIEVEDYLDQGYTCKETAEMLSIDIEEVYRIAQAKKRREKIMEKQAEKKTETKPIIQDPVAQAQQQIMLLKLEEQMDRIQERQDQKALERQAAMQEFVGKASDDPDLMIENIFAKALVAQEVSKKAPRMASSGHLPQPQQYVYGESSNTSPLSQEQQEHSSAAATPIAAAPAPGMDPQKIISAVKAGMISEKMFMQYAVEYGLTADQAAKAYEFIRRKI